MSGWEIRAGTIPTIFLFHTNSGISLIREGVCSLCSEKERNEKRGTMLKARTIIAIALPTRPVADETRHSDFRLYLGRDTNRTIQLACIARFNQRIRLRNCNFYRPLVYRRSLPTNPFELRMRKVINGRSQMFNSSNSAI